MRDKDRIRPFLDQLATEWEKVPDWRFGQLIVNTLGENPFYIEDEKAIVAIKQFFKK